MKGYYSGTYINGHLYTANNNEQIFEPHFTVSIVISFYKQPLSRRHLPTIPELSNEKVKKPKNTTNIRSWFSKSIFLTEDISFAWVSYMNHHIAYFGEVYRYITIHSGRFRKRVSWRRYLTASYYCYITSITSGSIQKFVLDISDDAGLVIATISWFRYSILQAVSKDDAYVDDFLYAQIVWEFIRRAQVY